MQRFLLLLALFLLCTSHFLFIRLDFYFLEPNQDTFLELFSGTFEESENTIERNRMVDVSLVRNGKRTKPDSTQWKDNGNISELHFNTGKPGTAVAGVSTRPKILEMSAEEFNEYLEHDGILDMLATRKQKNQLNQSSREYYSKHVKAIFQVGDRRTDDYKTVLGYPVELVPVQNPYAVKLGDSLQVQLLKDRKPLPNHLVFVGYGEPHHEHEKKGKHDHEGDLHDNDTQLRTNAKGVVTFRLKSVGHWYVRAINMVEVQQPTANYESKWATLTFEVK